MLALAEVQARGRGLTQSKEACQEKEPSKPARQGREAQCQSREDDQQEAGHVQGRASPSETERQAGWQRRTWSLGSSKRLGGSGRFPRREWSQRQDWADRFRQRDLEGRLESLEFILQALGSLWRVLNWVYPELSLRGLSGSPWGRVAPGQTTLGDPGWRGTKGWVGEGT